MTALIEIKKKTPVQYDSPLAHAFGFDLSDLQNNRQGFMSHWQKKRLRWHLLSHTISIAWVTFIAIIFPLGFISGTSLYDLTGLPALWTASVLAVFGMIWFMKIHNVWSDVRRNRVREVVAHVYRARKDNTKRFRKGDQMHEYKMHDHYVIIDNKRYSVSKEQMEAFKDGYLHEVYFAPQSRQILSAERMNGTSKKELFDVTSSEPLSDYYDEFYDELFTATMKEKSK